MKRTRLIGVLAGPALLFACTVGPDYQRPDAPVPAQYKEAGWKVGEPLDAINRGAWWSIYKDPVLDGLEKQIDISNQNLKAAAAAFEQAEWIVAQARANYFPTATIDASAQRSRGGGTAGGGTTPVGGGGASGRITNFFSTSTTASWTPDLWGRIRRLVESDVASAQASAGDLATARLAAQGALASDYLQLRVADELKRLLDATATYYAESLRITRNEYAVGTASESDVAQAETQLRSTEAQAIAVGVTRAQLEHADRSRHRSAGDPGRYTCRFARAAPRHCHGRAANGGGQCADRGCRRGILSDDHSLSRLRRLGADDRQAVFGAGAFLGVRIEPRRDGLRCRRARGGGQRVARNFRSDDRELPADGADRFSAGRRPTSGAAHSRSAGRSPSRSGQIGARG